MTLPDADSDVAHFNEWASSYDGSRIQRYLDQFHATMLDQVGPTMPPPRRILDIGCGTGRLLRRVGRRWAGAHLIGVDPAAAMIREASRLTPGAEFHVADAEHLPLSDASVDLALSAVSLHHWPDQLLGLREIARTLRPGGLLVLGDIVLPRWIRGLLRSRAQSRRGLLGLVRAADLTVVTYTRAFAGVGGIVTAAKVARAV